MIAMIIVTTIAKYDADFQIFASCTGGGKAAVTKFWAKRQHRLLSSFSHRLCTSLAKSSGRLGILSTHRLRHLMPNHQGADCQDISIFVVGFIIVFKMLCHKMLSNAPLCFHITHPFISHTGLLYLISLNPILFENILGRRTHYFLCFFLLLKKFKSFQTVH